MKTSIATAGLAVFVLATPAAAGPCTDEIGDLARVLSSTDAGSGPTLGGGPGGQGQAVDRTAGRDGTPQGATGTARSPSTTGQVGAAPSSDAPTSGATGSGTMGPGATPRAGEVPGTGATAAMNELTGDRATSPGDVRRQLQGQPSTGELASRAEPGQDASTPPDRQKMADEALNRARVADAAGDQAGCVQAIQDARRVLNLPAR